MAIDKLTSRPQIDKKVRSFLVKVLMSLCIPQRLYNAPATFQLATDNIIGDLKMPYVLVYHDDITDFSLTFVKHLDHLHSVFNCL